MQQTGPGGAFATAKALQTPMPAPRGKRPSSWHFGLDTLFLILVMLYLIVPLGATLSFGLSSGRGINFGSYQQIFTDHDFSQTLTLSLELALASTLLAVILVTPTVYWVQLRLPQARPLLDFLSRVLTEAAYSLGSGWWKTFFAVILPNIWPGVISAALLTFSTAMGEFTLAALFGVYTFPIYLNQVGQSDAHKAASLAILSFIFTLVSVLGIILLVRGRPGQQGEVEIAAAK